MVSWKITDGRTLITDRLLVLNEINECIKAGGM